MFWNFDIEIVENYDIVFFEFNFSGCFCMPNVWEACVGCCFWMRNVWKHIQLIDVFYYTMLRVQSL